MCTSLSVYLSAKKSYFVEIRSNNLYCLPQGTMVLKIGVTRKHYCGITTQLYIAQHHLYTGKLLCLAHSSSDRATR